MSGQIKIPEKLNTEKIDVEASLVEGLFKYEVIQELWDTRLGPTDPAAQADEARPRFHPLTVEESAELLRMLKSRNKEDQALVTLMRGILKRRMEGRDESAGD